MELRVADFDGETYERPFDSERLTKQLDRVKAVQIDGQWRTLEQISSITGDPWQSVSARLRDLRKERFGSYIVERRRKGEPSAGLWEYRLLPPAEEWWLEIEME